MSIPAINNAITALDTPSSLLPFFVKDSFDVTGRTYMANKEGGKHEAREKFIEEAGTSAFWIGGIPLVRFIGSKLFKGKIDSKIDFKRINSNGIQGYFAKDTLETVDKNGKKVFKNEYIKPKDLEGIVLDGEKLEAVQSKLQNEGFKINGSKGFYKKYNVGITAASVLINLAILAVGLPKFNQYLSRKIISKEANQNGNASQNQASNDQIQPQSQQAEVESQNKEQVSFKGIPSIKGFVGKSFAKMAENAQLNVQSSMLLLDFGISGSRVVITPRDNNERVENVVKEGGIIFFFYFAADIIKKGIANFANNVLKTPIDLDYKILNNKEFLKALKAPHDNKEFLKFADIIDKDAELKKLPKGAKKAEKDALCAKIDEANEIKVIKFIDKHLAGIAKDTNVDDIFNENFTLKTAQEDGLIKDVEYDEQLGRWVRNSKKYIKTDKIVELNDSLKNFCEVTSNAIKDNGKTFEQVISKTKSAKIFSVIGNIAICCASLSYFLPKLQYMIREHRTQTKAAPGIKLYQDMAANNELKA